MTFLDPFRQAHAAWYTQSPLAGQTDEELAAFIARLSLDTTVDELRTRATTPDVALTCALCGQPQTHLTACKGCGQDAWGWETTHQHGEDAPARLRAKLRARLETDGSFVPEQMENGVGHAYTWGGCLVCTDCWPRTLAVNAYQHCPLNRLAERTLSPNHPPAFLLPVLLRATEFESNVILDAHIENLLSHICAYWIESAGEAAARWRKALLTTLRGEV